MDWFQTYRRPIWTLIPLLTLLSAPRNKASTRFPHFQRGEMIANKALQQPWTASSESSGRCPNCHTQTIEYQDPTRYISPDLANTLRGGRVESSRFGEEEIKRNHGQTGTIVHETIPEFLRGRDVAHSPDGYTSWPTPIIQSECAFSNLDQNSTRLLKCSLAWACLALRIPMNNEFCISQGQWNNDKFTLQPLSPVNWRESCFRKRFLHGIVSGYIRGINSWTPSIISADGDPVSIDKSALSHSSWRGEGGSISVLWSQWGVRRSAVAIGLQVLKQPWLRKIWLGCIHAGLNKINR